MKQDDNKICKNCKFFDLWHNFLETGICHEDESNKTVRFFKDRCNGYRPVEQIQGPKQID